MIKKLLHLFKDSHSSFEGQEEGEEVILLLRQHRYTIFFPLSFLALFACIPMLVVLAFGSVIVAYGVVKLFFFATSLWFMVIWIVAFYYLMTYSLNTVILTNRRIIENEQLGIFNRKVSELHTYRVQDISVHTEGLIETFLNFGNIVVQTAATDKQFTFRNIPNPDEVKDTIMQVVTNHRAKANLT